MVKPMAHQRFNKIVLAWAKGLWSSAEALVCKFALTKLYSSRVNGVSMEYGNKPASNLHEFMVQVISMCMRQLRSLVFDLSQHYEILYNLPVNDAVRRGVFLAFNSFGRSDAYMRQ